MVARERAVLPVVYSAIGLLLALLARGGTLSPTAATVFLALLWLGFIVAISFTEAWVKFRAPFVPRYLALDVGRTVFAALNAVETGICIGLWLIRVVASSIPDGKVGILIALTALLVTQYVVIYPRLELRGEFAIYDSVKNLPDDALSFHQKMVLSEMKNTVQKHDKPGVFFHISYVLIEVAKVVLLIWFAFHFLSRLP